MWERLRILSPRGHLTTLEPTGYSKLGLESYDIQLVEVKGDTKVLYSTAQPPGKRISRSKMSTGLRSRNLLCVSLV